MPDLYAQVCPWLRGRSLQIYAAQLQRQIQARQPLSDLPFIFRGSSRSPAMAGLRGLTFSGDPHFLTTDQITEILQRNSSSYDNILVKREGEWIKVSVSPPADTPAEVLDLKKYYAQAKEAIIAAEMRRAPAERFEQPRVSAALKKLSFEALKRGAEIAERRAEEKFGLKDSRFAILLAAGSAAGPQLDSDLDYLIVYRGENKKYFADLARQLADVLFQCGIDGDNLIDRFSQHKIKALEVEDRAAYLSIFRIAADALPIEKYNDAETLRLFFANQAEVYAEQKRVEHHRSWHEIAYVIELREKSAPQAVLNPSVESRKLQTAANILRIKAGLTAERVPNTETLFNLLEERHESGPFQAEAILGTEEYFLRLKNALYYMYRGASSYFTSSDIPAAAFLLGYVEPNALADDILQKKQFLNDFFAFAKSRLEKDAFREKVYVRRRSLEDWSRKLWQRVKYGDLSVSFVCRHPILIADSGKQKAESRE